MEATKTPRRNPELNISPLKKITPYPKDLTAMFKCRPSENNA
jgi:hypothetical protein